MKKFVLSSVIPLSVLSACAGGQVVDMGEPTTGLPAVGSSNDLSAFVGARAGQSEMGIQNLGYQLIRTQGLTAYWFNPATGACAEIVTADGRYSSVSMLPAEDC